VYLCDFIVVSSPTALIPRVQL